MEIRRLRYFVRVAEDGSLTKAAGVLRVAQPALTRQIRLLEQEIGIALFNRTARGMQLTEEGEYLRGCVAGPLRAVELALQNVRSLSPRIEGNFAIGMPSSLGDVLAAPLVLRMSADFPNIRLRIMEGITGSLIDWLHRGMLDFALLEEESRDDRLTDREILSERLLLVGAAGTTVNPKRALTFEKVIQLPLILPTHHLGIRGVFNDALAKLRANADIRLEADSCKLIKELVVSGLGYAILPFSFFRKEYEAGSLGYSPIIKPALRLPLVLSYRTSDRASTNRVEGLVIDTLTRMLRELSAP
jgi:LysR family transcriptional regulator, nitrogen assimilation regulatory protein